MERFRGGSTGRCVTLSTEYWLSAVVDSFICPLLYPIYPFPFPYPFVERGGRGGGRVGEETDCSGASGAGLGLQPVLGSVVDEEAKLYR